MERQLEIIDRVLAIVVATLAVVINVGIHRPETFFLTFLLLGAGLVPAFLLWESKPSTMALLVFYSLACCQGAYVICDISPSDAWGILHISHDWLWLLSPYAVIRLVMMMFLRRSGLKSSSEGVL